MLPFLAKRLCRGVFGLILVVALTLGISGAASATPWQVGDVVTSFGDRSLGGVADLVDALREHAIGEAIEIEAERRGQPVRVRATLGSRPY